MYITVPFPRRQLTTVKSIFPSERWSIRSICSRKQLWFEWPSLCQVLFSRREGMTGTKDEKRWAPKMGADGVLEKGGCAGLFGGTIARHFLPVICEVVTNWKGSYAQTCPGNTWHLESCRMRQKSCRSLRPALVAWLESIHDILTTWPFLTGQSVSWWVWGWVLPTNERAATKMD
jgi:hypothetical protein